MVVVEDICVRMVRWTATAGGELGGEGHTAHGGTVVRRAVTWLVMRVVMAAAHGRRMVITTSIPRPARHVARRRRPLSSSLDREWRTVCHRARVVAEARRWGVTDQPFANLDELLVLAGYGMAPSAPANDVLRRLVDVAHHDELAARVVLQRLMPGLLAIVRRRRDADADGSFEELVGAACLAIHAYCTERRPERIAANLVRDAGYRAFTAPRRRRSATEISIDPRTLDETPAVVVVSACEELAGLMADAREAGVDRP